MLHIANGDKLMELMNRSRLPGSVVPWRELLMDGPAPAGLSDAEWINVRADHLYMAYGIPRNEVGIALRFQRDALDLTLTEDEVVLWFERDLLCQLHLVYVLTHIARLRLVDPNVTLVMPEWIDGLDVHSGLGQATVDQIMELFERRRRVTPEMFASAGAAFDAFTAPDPLAMMSLATERRMQIPGLNDSLLLQLRRFPDPAAGLPGFQRVVLEELREGPLAFPDLYSRVNLRLREYGITDFHVFNEALEISQVPNPLVLVTGHEGDGSPHQSGRVFDATLAITDIGRAALAGEFDHVAVNGVDGWIGGVHLVGHDVPWRWDGERLVQAPESEPRLQVGL